MLWQTLTVHSAFLSTEIWTNRFAVSQTNISLPMRAAKDRIHKNGQTEEAIIVYTSKKWADADSYDLCLNSSVLGIDGCVEMIKKMLEIKRRSF